jgi:hypothetical protein
MNAGNKRTLALADRLPLFIPWSNFSSYAPARCLVFECEGIYGNFETLPQ